MISPRIVNVLMMSRAPSGPNAGGIVHFPDSLRFGRSSGERSSRHRPLTIAWCALAGLMFASDLLGQGAVDTTAEGRAPQGRVATPIATLSSWANQVWLSLLDRDGSYFGRLATEGTFQRFNRLMDSEYELDIRSGMFTPAEDARWAEVGNGIRITGASISPPRILNVFDWHQESRISGPVNLLVRYSRERSLTAQRDYSWLGIRWHDVGGSD